MEREREQHGLPTRPDGPSPWQRPGISAPRTEMDRIHLGGPDLDRAFICVG
jgi:hypothetical protein